MDAPITKPSRLRLLGFSLLTVVLILGVVELFAWLLLRQLPIAPAPEEDPIERALASPEKENTDVDQGLERIARTGKREHVIHPFLGSVLHPQSTVESAKHHQEAVEFGIPYNRWPLFMEPSEERLVVAIFGGSVASILANNTIPILQQEIGKIERFKGREVVILSIALGGYRQPQQLIALNYFLALGAHMDVVINLDGFNEVALSPFHNIPRGVFPFFPNHWDLQTQTLNPQQQRIQGEITFLRHRRRERATQLQKSWLRYSSTAKFLWSVTDRRLTKRLGDLQLEITHGQDKKQNQSKSYHSRGPRKSYPSQDALFTDLTAVWARGSLQMFRLCNAAGIEYFHFLQPNQYVPDSKPLSPEEKRTAWSANYHHASSVAKGYPLMRKLGDELRQQGVPFYDVSRVFKNAQDTLYVDMCCHFNMQGNVLLARAMARAMHDAPGAGKATAAITQMTDAADLRYSRRR